jgi:hypothetical protein
MDIEIYLVLSASLTLIVTTCCYNIRRLRCTHIKCCGAECTRDLMSLEEIQADVIASAV